MASLLTITSPQNLQKEIIKILKSQTKPGIYLSLNKSPERIIKLLNKKKIDAAKIFFINLSNKNTAFLSINPKHLEDLNEAISVSSRKIKRKKFLLIDNLAIFLLHHKQKKIVKWVQALLKNADQKKLEILIFSYNAKSELLNTIFNFFDKARIR